MFYYFGYGSNMETISLQAKGAVPISSHPAMLSGWRLRFNVEHFFKHEGGMGNIEFTGRDEDFVLGVVHQLNDESLANLDEAEAYGVGYDRIKVPCRVEGEHLESLAYIGYPSFINDACLPTRRYLNILVKGARNAGLDAGYVEALAAHEILHKPGYLPFEAPSVPEKTYTAESLADEPMKTALFGCVFDMSKARKKHDYLKKIFGGKDMTLFHIKRMDSSTGNETIEDIKFNRLDERQLAYLNEYHHAYDEEYEYAGQFLY